jgi:hypothetical protein
MTSVVEDQEWITVIGRMDEERFPQPHAKPSDMCCGRARRIRDGATAYTGWHHSPIACADELDRNIMESRFEKKGPLE